MSSSLFCIERLPKPETDVALREQAMRLKHLRLRALRINPECFISRYEDEVEQEDEFWIERLRADNVNHWVASVRHPSSAEQDTGTALSAEWCALLVVIKRENEEKQDSKKSDCDTYWFAAMWVEPEMRGHGIGSSLIRAAIGAGLRSSRDQMHSSVDFEIEALVNNERAIVLYQKLGFTTVDAQYEFTGANGVVAMEHKLAINVDLTQD